MADDNIDNLYEDEADEDLLTTIQRWQEKALLEKQTRGGQRPPAEASLGTPVRMNNPWAPELTAAADRILQEGARGPREQDGLPPLWEKEAKPTDIYESPKRKKKSPFKRFVTWMLVIALALGAGGYGLAFAAAGKVDSKAMSNTDRAALRVAKGGALVTNILLLGVDQEEHGRTDTMLLLSIDHARRKLKLTSFLRDSWLTLPNGKSNKLNTAIHSGGAPATMRAISDNFKVRIDHYILVDFQIFAGLVDAVGGVSVPITDREANFLCRTAGPFKKMGREEIRRQMDRNGAVKLNGLEALVFCRIRKLDDDFMRTQRQRIFMNSLIAACKRNPLRLLGLAGGDTLSHVQTDMNRVQLANLAAMAPLLLTYGMEEFTVPAKGTWSYATKQGMAAITLDTSANAAKLREFIYEK